MPCHLKSSHTNAKNVSWKTWILQYDTQDCALTYESDGFELLSQRGAVWILSFLYKSSSVEIQLTLHSTEKPITCISGYITLSSDKEPCVTFPFGSKSLNSGQKLKFERTVESLNCSNLELLVLLRNYRQVHENHLDPSLSIDLTTLLFEDEFSDVTLEVDGDTIKAHQAILSARSQVFWEMCQSGTQEENMYYVEITDMSTDVLKEMLRYIYTGCVKNMTHAPELMTAANKYEIQELENMCREYLITNLSTEIAAKLLIMAYSLSDDVVLLTVTDFIVANLSEVLDSLGWKTLKKTHPVLMERILKAMCPQKSASK